MAAIVPPKVHKPTVRKQELEIDKLFRALVKLEGSDLHLKVDCPPHVRVKGTLRPLNRGPIDDEEMVRLLLADAGRAQPQDLRRDRRRRLRPRHGRRRRPLAIPRQHAAAAGPRGPGRSAREQLDSRLRGPVPAADHGGAVQVRPGHGPAGRRHGLGQEHDDRLDAQLDQCTTIASTSSRSKTRSNSSSPKTSA